MVYEEHIRTIYFGSTFAWMLLVIESSADFPSACVVNRAGEIVFSQTISTEKSHAEKLPLLIEEGLGFLRKNGQHLEAVAISGGPGSYTGLRIGTSLAKGICFGLGLPLVSINGLKAMGFWALGKYPDKKRALSMLDARRDEVYIQYVFSDGTFSEVTAEVIHADRCVVSIENDVFIGNANQKVMQLLDCAGMTCLSGPTADQLASQAYQKWQANEFESVAYFEPYYLKEFQAGISKKFSL